MKSWLNKLIILAVGVALAAPIFLSEDAHAARKAARRKVVVNGVEYLIAWKGRPITFRLEGPARVTVRVRPLVRAGARKSRSFKLTVSAGDKRWDVEVPSMKVEKGVTFRGLRRSVPAAEFVPIRGEAVESRLVRVKVISESTCLVRVEREKIAKPSPAPSLRKPVASRKSTIVPGLRLSLAAGPVYYHGTQSSTDSAGMGATLRVAFKFAPRLSAEGAVRYRYYRAGYIYAERDLYLKIKALLLDESRVTLNAGVAFDAINTSSFSLRIGGGYTYDGFINSTFPLHFNGVYAKAGLGLNVKKVSIGSGVCVAFRLWGTQATPALEGIPSFRLGVPASVRLPVSRFLDLRAGYSFEYVNFEQGSRFYNSVFISVGI